MMNKYEAPPPRRFAASPPLMEGSDVPCHYCFEAPLLQDERKQTLVGRGSPCPVLPYPNCLFQYH